MAWMRAVAGRLEMRYRYSNTIVYNNFPWPNADDMDKQAIEQLAQGVLDVRAKQSDRTLGSLYDPITMPHSLLEAHRCLDRAVLNLYGFSPSVSEEHWVAGLMNLYQKAVAVDVALQRDRNVIA